jgi:glycosyltransferase involved in cell wall biosynthesis
MKKVVIVMTYFERPHQLHKTLKSIAQTKYQNFEVVIVDDGSVKAPPPLYLSSFEITVLTTARKCWTNPEPAYNTGLYYAMLRRPDVIILQNAECYHVGDVISAAAKVTDENYITFGCFSIDKANTFRQHEITALLQANELGASHDGQNAWYNHPQYRPVAYDFCSAITAKNMLALNGYDERLADGCGRGDDYLLQRIKMLGIKVEITAPPAPFVVHQWHYDADVPADKAQRVERNRQLYAQMLLEGQPRAQHKYTKDLCDCS